MLDACALNPRAAVQYVCTIRHSPQTISSVHACMYCDKSKLGFPASLSKFSSIILVLSLKIGTNDCSIFKLNVGFKSLRIGFQKAPPSFSPQLLKIINKKNNKH